MAATQKDIAREAGVSQAVVSDVLQNHPRGRVSAATRARILETAHRLGYRPHAAAQALRFRRSRVILYLMLQPEDEHRQALAEPVLGGAVAACAGHEYRVLVETVATWEHAAEVVADRLAAGVCDGAILRVFDDPDPLWARLWELQKEGATMVVIGQCSDDRLASVAHDVPGMLGSAAEVFRSRGMSRLGLLAPPRNTRFGALMWHAWETVAERMGLEWRPWTRALTSRSQAEHTVYGWLQELPRPEALICYGDPVGLGAGAACRLAGHPVGSRVERVVVGNADLEWLHDPGVWRLPTSGLEVGRRAAEMVVQLLARETTPAPVRVLPELTRVESSLAARPPGSQAAVTNRLPVRSFR